MVYGQNASSCNTLTDDVAYFLNKIKYVILRLDIL